MTCAALFRAVAFRDSKAIDVAFLLGFSNASAFYRAFRRWTGATPVEYRQRATNALR